MVDDIAVLIVAAGRGERAAGKVPKQFAPLSGIPVVARAVDSFGELPIWVVIGQEQEAHLTAALNARRIKGSVTGGTTRQESVRNGLEAIMAAGGARKVLIHDAARPLVPRYVLDALIASLQTAAAAVPVVPVPDTVARADQELGPVVDRAGLVRVQTPQAFHLDAILAAHKAWTGDAATDDAQIARAAGIEVVTVPGDPMLDKITYPQDFARAESALAARIISRSAMGFDVHRLEPGEELWLSGIRIEHSYGLSGHSDADVALHALTDALLGTIAEGDIGSHFPPSDAQWRGVASHRFVEHARDLILERGGRIDHVDLTIICEAPRIGPHRQAMQARIAEILRLPTASVSVKATTTEGLGLTGRGEGIAAQAVATVSLEGRI